MFVRGCAAAGSDSAPSGSMTRLLVTSGIGAVVTVEPTPSTPSSGSNTSGSRCPNSTCGSRRWYCVR